MESKAEYALCEKCPFKDRPFAKTTGPEDAKIAVVSRSPGHHEVLQGKSFSGPSGKVLDHLLELHGVSGKDVLKTNVVLCQSDGQEPGFGMAQACCEPRLQSELANVETIIAAGSEALYGILQESGIGYNRGFAHTLDSPVSGKEQRVIVTNNPAMVLRDDKTFPELVRDFRLAINPLPQPKLPTVKWTENLDEAKRWCDDILSTLKSSPGTILSVDIEGGYPNLACIGFAIRPERAVVMGIIPCQDEGFRRDYIGKLLSVEGIEYLYQFGKYDTKELRRFGINARVDHDTGLLSYALDERPGNPESGAGGHSLEWLLKDELGWPRYEPPSVKDFKKDEGKKTGAWKEWPDVLPDKRTRIDLYEYNGMDTAGSLALFAVLKARAINDGVFEKPYLSQLLPLNKALTEVELYGNLWDAEAACDILEEEVWPKLAEWKQVLRQIAKIPDLNPNSPPQLDKLLYETWQIKHDLDRPKVERKGKRSTDKAVREVLMRGDFRIPSAYEPHRNGMVSFVERLDKWKELETTRNRYLEGLTLKRSPDGRIYTTFKIHGTESGRLSSENPNMQNITRPKEGIPNIRRVFVADPGTLLISCDLSQAELRTIAVLSGDPELQAVYLDTNRSLHKEAAATFYGEDYTYEQYVRAKNINFGVAYWQSAFTFAQMYNMPQEEAQAYIDWWWDRFPRVWDWTKETEKEILTNGELQSPFGHKRRFYVIPNDQSAKLHIIKQGINFKPQNIAANITNYALTQLVLHELDPAIAQIRNTVHDAIIACAKEDYVDETATVMKQVMEAAPKACIGWDFPFIADISTGHTWGDLKEDE